MSEWNVLVTTHKDGYRQAMQLLGRFGPVSRTDYFNVLTMWCEDIPELMEELRQRAMAEPELLSTVLARVTPVSRIFHFSTQAEFEARAGELVLTWLGQLANKAFHVRMHRRGFKKRISSLAEERFLDELLLKGLEERGTPGRISFEDPDAVLMLETLGNQAGLALWSREELNRYPFLHPD